MSRAVFACLLVLAGCATTSVSTGPTSWPQHVAAISDIDQWHIEGKIGFSAPGERGSATLVWDQDNNRFDLTLSGPFGIGTTRLSGTGELATLIHDDRTLQAPASDLAEYTTGLRVPVDTLIWWVRGLPDPNAPSHISFDGLGLPTSLKQHDWQVDYQRYQNTQLGPLPGKLVVTRDGYKLTLVINRWELPAQ